MKKYYFLSLILIGSALHANHVEGGLWSLNGGRFSSSTETNRLEQGPNLYDMESWYGRMDFFIPYGEEEEQERQRRLASSIQALLEGNIPAALHFIMDPQLRAYMDEQKERARMQNNQEENENPAISLDDDTQEQE